MKIAPFRGDYGFLSNMWECPVTFEGINYPSAEHAYQAAKYDSRVVRLEIAALDNPVKAKRFPRLHKNLQFDPKFDENKLRIMGTILSVKFTMSPKLGQWLVETHPHELVEEGWWHDGFWGTCTCGKCAPGKNHLGKLLMEVRSSLKGAK